MATLDPTLSPQDEIGYWKVKYNEVKKELEKEERRFTLAKNYLLNCGAAFEGSDVGIQVDYYTEFFADENVIKVCRMMNEFRNKTLQQLQDIK